MKNKTVIISLILTFFGALSACGSGQIKDVAVNKDVAVVKGLPAWNPLSVIAVRIYKIDGKKIKKAVNRHELAAGQHEIEVRCSRETPTRVQRYFIFDMYLKAGHEYKPKLDMSKDCYLDYVDSVTGKKYIGIED